jgi:hypothetical protein
VKPGEAGDVPPGTEPAGRPLAQPARNPDDGITRYETVPTPALRRTLCPHERSRRRLRPSACSVGSTSPRAPPCSVEVRRKVLVTCQSPTCRVLRPAQPFLPLVPVPTVPRDLPMGRTRRSRQDPPPRAPSTSLHRPGGTGDGMDKAPSSRPETERCRYTENGSPKETNVKTGRREANPAWKKPRAPDPSDQPSHRTAPLPREGATRRTPFGEPARGARKDDPPEREKTQGSCTDPKAARQEGTREPDRGEKP